MKKTSKSISQLKKEAWGLFRAKIIKRDTDWRGYGRCFTCGKVIKAGTREAHIGHFVHGSTKKSYFYGRNCHLQCRSCNFYKDGARDVYALKLVERYGNGIIQEIHAVNNDKSVWTIGKLKEIINNLKNERNQR